MSDRRSGLVRVADGLTFARLVVALGLIVPTALGLYLWSSAAVVVAWATDFFDGRLARAAGREGRLARWDLPIDTSIGAALVIGFAFAEVLPWWLATTALAVLGGLYVVMRNVAAAMLVQALGYGALLVVTWQEHRAAFWTLVAVAVVIGVVDWEHLFKRNLPNFFRGLVGRPPVS